MINSSTALLINSTSAWFLTTPGSDNLTDLISGNHSAPEDLSSVTGSPQVSDRPCAGLEPQTSPGAESSTSGQTPAAAATDGGISMPGSLDALLYIVIVLLFYAFSIVILMVKYVRREREEASLRNYYHEFVSRDKFKSPQYRNKQSMRRILGRRWRRDRHSRHSDHSLGGDDIEDQGGTGQMCEAVLGEDTCGHSAGADFQRGNLGNKEQSQTITFNGGTFSRLLTDCEDDNEKREKESFKFLSAKNQFCKKGFFGKRFCNKQMCSKCVSESDAPTIDWGDGKCTNTDRKSKDVVEIRLYDQSQRVSDCGDKLRGGAENCVDYRKYRDNERRADQQLTYTFDRADDGCFQPIIECDSELEEIDPGYRLGRHDYLRDFRYNSAGIEGKRNNPRRGRAMAAVHVLQPEGRFDGRARHGTWHEKDRPRDETGATAFEEAALVSSCSLEVSELLANMPPLGGLGGSNKSHDLDTLDGLSNLESETENQSFFNHSVCGRGPSASARGSDDVCRFSPSEHRPPRDRHSSCGDKRDAGCSDGRQRDLSDFLSERTSLLSCTLSIADDGDEEEDEGGTTNPTSFHQNSHSFSLPYANSNGLSHSNSNGKTKDDLKSNGKSFFRSLSKSASSEDGDVMRILNDISLLTEDSGVFKNLKYFLRGFSTHDEEPAESHERSSLLPKETYFGPGSPKSIFATSPGDNVSESAVVIPTTCESVGGPSSGYRHKSQSAPIPDTGTGRADCDLLGLDLEGDEFKLEEDDDFPSYGEDRWAYAYDEDEEALTSDGERSSSFGDYCMGTPSESQVIDLSLPLARRHLDERVKAKLSQAFYGISEPWEEAAGHDDQPWRQPVEARGVHKPNPLVAGYGPARKETKV
ncbi:hypothetical protein EGW08_021695 [Elysia chlorotica]|uniref:Uncharacterized protein n=1 Tax=Elysia chlorotica TaxID=188477 RepID=A0A433SMX8_ELYCH|nr:hypothetical protein EGW08_021695 [Elysia chlorotica]